MNAITVEQGRRVKPGEVLARLTAAGGIDESERDRLLAEYRAQLEAVEDRIANAREEREQERAKVEQDSTALLAAINRHREIVRLQADKAEELRKTRDAARPLYDTGMLPRLSAGRIRRSYSLPTRTGESMPIKPHANPAL
ncbi:MAG: hypothetical protein U5O39_04750 [Gammaproteobacteria bacterium]|nr:hypothetical protein [Gammaproteobacteria bacterium]